MKAAKEAPGSPGRERHEARLRMTVVVPTYHRPRDLARCLEALTRQERAADEVIVVAREGDKATWSLLEELRGRMATLRTLTVRTPGVVAAMNLALQEASGNIIAFTDDDAAPYPDWISRIEAYFVSEPRVAGVGGRDWIWHAGARQEGSCTDVGRISWFGRVIGNHHLGVGPPRQVESLKGVNCAYRVDTIRDIGLDERLRGSGAQVRHELALGLALRRRGWRLVYDPAIQVDHFEGARFDQPRVGHLTADPSAVADAAYNEALILIEHFGLARGAVYVIWSFLVGTTLAPGLIQALRYTPHLGAGAWRRFLGTQRGKMAAYLFLLRRPRA